MSDSPKFAIVIPARFGSTRFPGKPLAKIGGKPMLNYVVDVARKAAEGFPGTEVLVTTENKNIADHCKTINVECIITPDDCPTGSDRVLAAIEQKKIQPDFVVNLQGDAPFTPPSVVHALIEAYQKNPKLEVITPIHRLSWNDLDRLREAKRMTPFSGTTVTTAPDGRAIWFSKIILPAIRMEKTLREKNPISPVQQHLGLYGFRTDILKKFCGLKQTTYELLEGLEQLRMLEHGIHIQTVKIEVERSFMQGGIDTQEDILRAEKLLALHGNTS